jgi:hypothetical protein
MWIYGILALVTAIITYIIYQCYNYELINYTVSMLLALINFIIFGFIAASVITNEPGMITMVISPIESSPYPLTRPGFHLAFPGSVTSSFRSTDNDFLEIIFPFNRDSITIEVMIKNGINVTNHEAILPYWLQIIIPAYNNGADDNNFIAPEIIMELNKLIRARATTMTFSDAMAMQSWDVALEEIVKCLETRLTSPLQVYKVSVVSMLACNSCMWAAPQSVTTRFGSYLVAKYLARTSTWPDLCQQTDNVKIII